MFWMSCREAGISRKTAYQWKEEDEEFAERGRMPTKTASICSNTPCAAAPWQTSDKLGQFLLRSPPLREKQHEHSGPGGAPIPVAGNVVSIMDEDDEEPDEG